MNWDGKDKQITFQEFRDMADLYFEAKGIEIEVMWKHIVLQVGQGTKRRGLKMVLEKLLAPYLPRKMPSIWTNMKEKSLCTDL